MNAADLTWTTAACDETGGSVQVEYLPGAPRQAMQVLALTGHYAIVAEGDDLLICPRIEGGDAIAGKTPRDGAWPGGDPQVLDAGIIGRTRTGGAISWGAHIRIRGDKVEIIGSAAVDGIKLDGETKVARDGDDCNRNAAMAIWMGQVELICNGLVPGGVTPLVEPSIADVLASTTKVKAG